MPAAALPKRSIQSAKVERADPLWSFLRLHGVFTLDVMQMISVYYFSVTCRVCRSCRRVVGLEPTKRKGEIMNNSQCAKLAAGLTAIGMSLAAYGGQAAADVLPVQNLTFTDFGPGGLAPKTIFFFANAV
jgi:hypothetical protein